MKLPATALGLDDDAAERQRHEERSAGEREALHLVPISDADIGHLPGEALSYFALLLTFQPAARHLICGPLQAVVFPGCLCWFVLRFRRRGGCGVLLGGFHFIHLSSR
jgi:hypothetical protein